MDEFIDSAHHYIQLTPNEMSAMMKNLIEERLLENNKKILRNEHKQNCIMIKNMKVNTETLLDAIRKTTGSSMDKIEKILKFSTNALSMNMNSLSKNPFLQNKLRSQSVSPKRVVKFSYNPSETRERKTKSASVLQLNKKKQSKVYQNDDDENLEVFVFEDKILYKSYLEMCRERDQVPRSLPKRIDILKRKDPVFENRHKIFLSAKICNKAPKFDLKDYSLPNKLPSATLRRERDKIIKSKHSVIHEKPKLFLFEMENIKQKVKYFVENFDSQNY